MKKIFEQGEFSSFRQDSLIQSRGDVNQYLTNYFGYRERITTVFLSHEHGDADELKDVIGFLQCSYRVRVYIDSRDGEMPNIPSAQTAANLKKRIRQCDKFLMLATGSAVKSPWCNWELGFGDAHKFESNIALLPVRIQGTDDGEYPGNEYLSLYPYITYYDGSEKYADGTAVENGYYVRTEREDGGYIVPLKTWLSDNRADS